jgi:hypothetical protein
MVLQNLKDSAEFLPYVFEGEIISSELFVGDQHGEKIKNPIIEWQDSVGSIVEFGNGCSPMVQAEIKIIRSYKGKIRPNTNITVLQKVDAIRDIWYEVNTSGDTLIKYELTEGNTLVSAFNSLIPGPGFSPRRLFFCRHLQRIESERNININAIDTFVQIPLDPNKTSMTFDKKAHPGLLTLLLFRESDIKELIDNL